MTLDAIAHGATGDTFLEERRRELLAPPAAHSAGGVSRPWLTTSQAAELLGVSARLVLELPLRFRRSGRHGAVRVSAASVAREAKRLRHRMAELEAAREERARQRHRTRHKPKIGPLREVAERLEGGDRLSCGHVFTTRYSVATSHRCVECQNGGAS